jgi:hypothetical protein
MQQLKDTPEISNQQQALAMALLDQQYQQQLGYGGQTAKPAASTTQAPSQQSNPNYNISNAST